MDIQVLNEIANQLRQVSLSKGGTPVSANAQLKGLKGNPIAASFLPTPPSSEETSGPDREPVTPDISSVARAASDYSASVGGGLNRDELGAIQDLAVRVRTVVSDFLSQPGVEQAENVEALVAANPEEVEALTSSLEQAVVDTLQISPQGTATETVVPANETVIKAIPAANQQISLERVTQGTRRNIPDQGSVVKPVNVEESVRADVKVAPQSNAPVEVENSHGDFRVVAASPALQNAQAGDNARVETPVSRPEVAVSPNNQETPVVAASPAIRNAQAGSHANVETPVSRPEVIAVNQQTVPATPAVSPNNQETPVVAASPAIRNAQAGSHANVETPVSRPEVIAVNQQTVPATPAVSPNNQETPVVAVSPAIRNAQAGSHAKVETLVNRPEATSSSQPESVSRPKTVETNSQGIPVTPAVSLSNQETPVVAASPAIQNTQAGSPANAETPVSQGQGRSQAPVANAEQSIVSPEEAKNEAAPNSSRPQPASGPQPAPAQTRGLFAPEQTAVNPGNIRNVNELVNSVVDNEFSSEAKKIFSEPKVIRTVADLADFILERLREIFLTKQQSSQSSVGIS